MSALMLVAASGLAREVIALEQSLRRYSSLTIVDDDPALWGTDVNGVPVVGPLEMAAQGTDDLLLCAGKGASRRMLAARLACLGVGPERYGRVIHPGVEIPPGCSVGPGCILLAGVVLTAEAHLHSHVVVMPSVTITHDVVVRDFATLCAGVSLGGGVFVSEAAYLGMGSSVREWVTVGPDAVLGMGAVLLEDLPGSATWVGVPAQAITRHRDHDSREEMSQ